MRALHGSYAAALSVGVVVLSLLWHLGLFPWVPVVSEVVGLTAMLLAPGVAIESAFHPTGWSMFERFGFAAAISFALAAVAGVGLHLLSLPVSTLNLFLLTLPTTVALALIGLRQPSRPDMGWTLRRRAGVVSAAGGLGLLCVAFITILTLRPAPSQPPLEVAIVDQGGALVALPLNVNLRSGAPLRVALRAPSGAQSSVSVSVQGDGMRAWKSGVTPTTSAWSTVVASIVPLRTGTIRASVDVQSAGATLRLPIEIVVVR